jgi:hypothetical protein
MGIPVWARRRGVRAALSGIKTSVQKLQDYPLDKIEHMFYY